MLSLCVSMPLESLVEIKIEFECHLHCSDIYKDDCSKRQCIKMKENANIPLKYCIKGTLCGSVLPDFLLENQEYHANEFVMPVRFRKVQVEGEEERFLVDIKMRMHGKQIKDSNNKHLSSGKK